MNRIYRFSASLFVMLFSLAGVIAINAQDRRKQTFTGTVLIYGTGFNTRTVTRLFTLNINGTTPDNQAQNYLSILQESGQDKLLDAIDNNDLGRFSIGPNVGVPINVVRESTVNGKLRVFVVFRRVEGFGELRGGYRSLDYPFGVIEMYVDPRTGKGDGTYIAAAQIRWKSNNRGETPTVEIENFATYPAKLLGVTRR